MSYDDASLDLHAKVRGKLRVETTVPLETKEDLSLAYTPGVAAPCRAIAQDPEQVYRYTIKSHTVAVITDGSAVLGLGNIGAKASLPVMEGKCALFKRFAGVDAFPIALETQNVEEIVRIVTALAPVFGGINLEDISAPRCVEIEQRLSTALDIPVFHDDQHGTATVVLAGMLNAAKVVGKELSKMKIVVSGAGAAGSAIVRLLHSYGVGDIIVTDSKGVVTSHRDDLGWLKVLLASFTNKSDACCMLYDALKGADAFVGVSKPGVLKPEMIAVMAKDPIIFALANPDPEMMPDAARAAGAAVVATGRSDFPNQLNNVLVFPGIFRGALDARIRRITPGMLVKAAEALAALVPQPTVGEIIPGVFDARVVEAVSAAVSH
ncbi:MAG TPA: NAD-dependent malic enzyme [Candidatus Peribacter riflensis]|uniref:Malic enzyme n=1 Tax=Candidatus Peribacter riflensis TaxID=1735162 RepID=A0A0S1SHF5_9BACT|nr:MAG: Malic enzyme [Candidatus Peribacter riflensis]OGJ79259.1 MAG: malate dehydrogenase [Candidatus Peribacteria bacterium RIFOXYB1_FULL_57_12]OGJ80951.1 MAG: malate dehydrogenase [Candidatus Peribacteria bacterium RIFOXYC1_FULL_58_8]ALM10932.1 MAG: Malic enzyme [Candidatus Peribacter riflensis]ALM12035.1 MAG: Malic enzyme [Candidatus Peribacter riflensis]